MSSSSFEDLQVWQRSCRLSLEIYKAFRENKDFGFRDQIQRSSVSVPSNISEGSERGSQKDFIRFLNYAMGSNAELRTQLYLAKGLDYLSAETANPFIQETKEIASMLRGLIKSLQQ